MPSARSRLRVLDTRTASPMSATKWWKYGDCPRLTCPAKRGEPCQDGHYGRVLKHPHSSRHVVEYLPTERQVDTAEVDRAHDVAVAEGFELDGGA